MQATVDIMSPVSVLGVLIANSFRQDESKIHENDVFICNGMYLLPTETFCALNVHNGDRICWFS